MAFQGSLKTLSVPDLFSLLYQLGKTGTLSLVSEFEERLFLFYRGNIVFATTKDNSRRLGAFLARLGIVTQRDVDSAVINSSADDIYLGQRFVEKGKISLDQLNLAVRAQILDIVEELMTWKTGGFHFTEDSLPIAIPDGSPISTHFVILEATRRSDEKAYVQKLFPDINVVLARTEAISGSPMKDAESETLRKVDGARTIEQILFEDPGNVQETSQALHELVKKGYLRQVGVQVRKSARFRPELYCLPVSPNVPGKVFATFNQEDSQLGAIQEILAQDPVLSAKVLRIVASRKEQLLREKIGIERMVSTLGMYHLKSILIPEAIRGLLFSRGKSFWKECWEHSFVCAQLCRRVALMVNYPFPEEAYLSGLLHNLGSYMLMNNEPEMYVKVVRKSVEEQVDLEDLEEQVFGISHTKAGATYAEKCNFPRSVASAIKGHHQPRSCPGNALLCVLSVANELAAVSGVGIEYVSSGKEQFEVALKELGIGRRQALSLVGKAPRRVLVESKL